MIDARFFFYVQQHFSWGDKGDTIRDISLLFTVILFRMGGASGEL